MYMKVTSVGITLIFTWKPECFPQFCHPKKFWILTDRTTKFWQSSWCNVQNSFFDFQVFGHRAALRRGCVGCHCCSRELENVTTDFDKWKKIHFYHTILSFHCGFAKKPKLFCLSWVYGVYSISKLFLFVQTFIQEKITFLRCTTAKQKWEKSIWIFLVEFSTFKKVRKGGCKLN